MLCVLSAYVCVRERLRERARERKRERFLTTLPPKTTRVKSNKGSLRPRMALEAGQSLDLHPTYKGNLENPPTKEVKTSTWM